MNQEQAEKKGKDYVPLNQYQRQQLRARFSERLGLVAFFIIMAVVFCFNFPEFLVEITVAASAVCLFSLHRAWPFYHDLKGRLALRKTGRIMRKSTETHRGKISNYLLHLEDKDLSVEKQVFEQLYRGDLIEFHETPLTHSVLPTMVFWRKQVKHFYGIAIYGRSDYYTALPRVYDYTFGDCRLNLVEVVVSHQGLDSELVKRFLQDARASSKRHNKSLRSTLLMVEGPGLLPRELLAELLNTFTLKEMAEPVQVIFSQHVDAKANRLLNFDFSTLQGQMLPVEQVKIDAGRIQLNNRLVATFIDFAKRQLAYRPGLQVLGDLNLVQVDALDQLAQVCQVNFKQFGKIIVYFGDTSPARNADSFILQNEDFSKVETLLPVKSLILGPGANANLVEKFLVYLNQHLSGDEKKKLKFQAEEEAIQGMSNHLQNALQNTFTP